MAMKLKSRHSVATIEVGAIVLKSRIQLRRMAPGSTISAYSVIEYLELS
jgi:hypothetical protein